MHPHTAGRRLSGASGALSGGCSGSSGSSSSSPAALAAAAASAAADSLHNNSSGCSGSSGSSGSSSSSSAAAAAAASAAAAAHQQHGRFRPPLQQQQQLLNSIRAAATSGSCMKSRCQKLSCLFPAQALSVAVESFARWRLCSEMVRFCFRANTVSLRLLVHVLAPGPWRYSAFIMVLQHHRWN